MQVIYFKALERMMKVQDGKSLGSWVIAWRRATYWPEMSALDYFVNEN